MLRGSNEQAGRKVDLMAVTGEAGDDVGVPDGQLLCAFAEAVLGNDGEARDEMRSKVRKALGDEALVDAAAVVALFTMADRCADSAGIPLEDEKVERTEGLRSELGLNEFRNIAEA